MRADAFPARTKTHGTLTFPYTVYKVDIPEFLRAYPPHLHAAAELIYIENGGGTVCVDACRYAAERGDIFYGNVSVPCVFVSLKADCISPRYSIVLC